MNKGNLKGTNSDGGNPTSNEKNAVLGQDSLVLGTKRFFVDGLTPSNAALQSFAGTPLAAHPNPELYIVNRLYQPIKVNGITGWAKP
jgi:hypothetical protein